MRAFVSPDLSSLLTSVLRTIVPIESKNGEEVILSLEVFSDKEESEFDT